MSEWICPNCKGGFPGSAMLQNIACPWCEFMFGEEADVRRHGSHKKEGGK